MDSRRLRDSLVSIVGVPVTAALLDADLGCGHDQRVLFLPAVSTMPLGFSRHLG